MTRAVIIGGGLGGLSAAITLRNNGYDVTVLEKNNHFGGKLMPVQIGSHYFDFGPNTITMPHIFQKVIEQTGEKAADYFQYIKLDTHTRNFFSDGTTFDLSGDKDIMVNQFSKFDPKARYEAFLTEVERLYELSAMHFLPRTFTSWKDYLSPSLTKALLQVRPLQSLDHFFRMYFHHPNILQAFNRYATYIGSSPYAAPATFAMIAHLELTQGVYYVKGGNTKIAEAFVKIAKKLGITLHTNAEVTSVLTENKQVKGVVVNGEHIDADVVIMNADLLQAYPALVTEEKRPSFSNKKVASYEPSISAFVILAGLNMRHKDLLHHNVFFSSNYKQEFTQLFMNKQYASDPTIYICNSSHTDPNVSPEGDNFFILVNAPSTENKENHPPAQEYKEHIYNILEQKGLSIRSHLINERIITPTDIEETFGAYKGALYGISANKRQNAFLRPFNQSKDIHNLYFVGGTTHPGGGSPMVTISGMNVAREIIKQQKAL
ncbi:phytoene desaturase family protein [Ectobacillus sp. JY-23]|uniref:phytoene desaturase family protein n=1 Tax=Ectobacillus sp. JY-23 TaxID=2933872 RepID=UPI001FF4F2E6|nr:phytoene desaturase family protein [Ectobacillus sp. JY-23]UOY92099.1 phytoene desaturase family protein [Ectobacillus sp. JY-23]